MFSRKVLHKICSIPNASMMDEAAISVAYRAKPIVREFAAFALDHSGLDGVLNLFL